MTAMRPLKGLRVIVTMPPRDWYGGVDYRFAVDMADGLRRLGAAVFDLDVTGFNVGDTAYVDDAIAAARSFRADLAMALPNAGYAIVCRTVRGENVFSDVLEIPTIMVWDHGAIQFAPLVLGPLPQDPEKSRAGCIRKLRDVLSHPLWIHYSPDRGHTSVMDRLGILDRNQVHPFVHTAWPTYVRHGRSQDVPILSGPKLAFAGNLFLDAASKLTFRNHEILAGVESRMLEAKSARLTTSVWELLLEELDKLDPFTLKQLRLQPDSSFFWSFMCGEVELVGTTTARLQVLSAIRRPCDFFGNFIEPQMAPSLAGFGLTFQRNLDCISELPFLYQHTDLMIDVVHPGYISGVSPKILACMACGGMVLFDYRDDLRQAMGEIVDSVMFQSIDQLNSLIEAYLGDPRKRRRLARELQQRVLSEFTFDGFATRVLVDQPVWRRANMPVPQLSTAVRS
jgi:Glycosyl transferases group 1